MCSFQFGSCSCFKILFILFFYQTHLKDDLKVKTHSETKGGK